MKPTAPMTYIRNKPLRVSIQDLSKNMKKNKRLQNINMVEVYYAKYSVSKSAVRPHEVYCRNTPKQTFGKLGSSNSMQPIKLAVKSLLLSNPKLTLTIYMPTDLWSRKSVG